MVADEREKERAEQEKERRDEERLERIKREAKRARADADDLKVFSNVFFSFFFFRCVLKFYFN